MRLAVSGYYGCGNAGDEAVLAGIKTAFARQAGPEAELVVLSQRPDDTTRLHGLPSVDRMNAAAVRKTIAESDLLLSGGGSLLQDTTSLKSLLYYLWVMRVAYSVKKPVMFYAQGIGPLRRKVSRALVRLVANRASALAVRDAPSAELLRAIGVSTPIEVTADPAFALSPAPEEAIEALCAAEGIPFDTSFLAVAFRPWRGTGESPVPLYARLLAELTRQTSTPIVLLPMHVPDDVEFGDAVAASPEAPPGLLQIRSAAPPEVLLGLVARSQGVVAMRLHTLIFAARAAVPLFALSYDPKVESLMKSLNLGEWEQREHWRGFEPDKVAARISGMLHNRASVAVRLREGQAERERLALRNADIALEIMREKTPHKARKPVV